MEDGVEDSDDIVNFGDPDLEWEIVDCQEGEPGNQLFTASSARVVQRWEDVLSVSRPIFRGLFPLPFCHFSFIPAR